MTSTLIIHCQWEDETARKETGHITSYAEAKKAIANTSYSCLPQV